MLLRIYFVPSQDVVQTYKQKIYKGAHKDKLLKKKKKKELQFSSPPISKENEKSSMFCPILQTTAI